MTYHELFPARTACLSPRLGSVTLRAITTQRLNERSASATALKHLADTAAPDVTVPRSPRADRTVPDDLFIVTKHRCGVTRLWWNGISGWRCITIGAKLATIRV